VNGCWSAAVSVGGQPDFNQLCWTAKMREESHKIEFPIKNKLGFHVRPIQRFAEMAQAFDSEVEVRVEDRKADGKSVLQLMGLRGNKGARMEVIVTGTDANQCSRVLGFLGKNSFFVEDNLQELHPERHLQRLFKIASCFESEIYIDVDGERRDAKNLDEVKELDIEPSTKVDFHVEGEDAEQARSVLQKLTKYKFYIEEKIETSR